MYIYNGVLRKEKPDSSHVLSLSKNYHIIEKDVF